MANDKYEVVIGLEVHAELKTQSKVFCSCANKFGNIPNTNCCPVCIGLPGALPIINKKAVEYTIKAGLCMNCEINDIAVFERKNYFYPDLSKAYQISQLVKPICVGGGVWIQNHTKFIRLDRIHLEEDAGKLIHKNEQVGTLIDYNRGGVPLIEMVSMPDIRSSEEAIEFLNALRNNLIYANLADCKMEQGGMRCDVNVSVRPFGQKEYGTRCEMKNLNSFRSVARAIEYESNRQIELVESGQKVIQETRRWDDDKGKSFTMRSKENSSDYRYFPDPDILAIKLDRELVERCKKDIPELPQDRKMKYINEYNLSKYDANQLVADKVVSDFFENVLKQYNKPKEVANWIMTEVLKYVEQENGEIKLLIEPTDFACILKMYEAQKIGQKNAKRLIEICANGNSDAEKIAKENNMLNDITIEDIEKIIDDVLLNNQKAKEDYKTNPDKVLTFFVGQVMRATKGKASPDQVKEIVVKKMA